MWTWLGAYQVGVTACTLAVAGLVLAARPDRFQNRALAAVLAAFGLMGLGSQGLIQLTDDRGLAAASQALLYALSCGVSFVYLAFLGTLPSPLARPFGGAGMRRALLALGAAWAALGALSLDRFVAGFAPGPGAAVWVPVPTGAAVLLFYLVAAVVLYGFVVALDLLHRAPRGTPLRAQAAIYALAFGVRDVWYAGALLAIPLVRTPAEAEALRYQFPTLTLAFAALLGYGLLRYQLFDLDLRVKWTLRRGTVGAVLLGAFFVVSELAQVVFSEVVGTLLGVLAAGLVVVLLAPVQRLADGLADKAMPGVRDTAEYRYVRKREVYRAALDAALVDGTITDKERDILARLQDELGLGATEARALEREARAAFGA